MWKLYTCNRLHRIRRRFQHISANSLISAAHGPGLKTFTEPTCLAKPWAAAWELYVAHAVKQGYAKHLVPRPCAEEPSGSCLPAACAE